jgi:hypothetical protein
MKGALLVIAAILIIFFLPATIESINDFRSTDYLEPHIEVTAPGVTDVDIVLSQDLFGSRTANVTITSDNALDAPVPFAYTPATNTLNITGLAANDTRTLAVTYKIDNLTDFWGAGTAVKTWPMLLIVAVFGLISAGVYVSARGRGGD